MRIHLQGKLVEVSFLKFLLLCDFFEVAFRESKKFGAGSFNLLSDSKRIFPRVTNFLVISKLKDGIDNHSVVFRCA